MNELYAEASVKRKITTTVVFQKALIIVGLLILFFLSILSGVKFMLMVWVGLVIAVVWFWPRFNIEWEYIFCDGQFDFDMIMGGAKRKNVYKTDMEQVEIVAPKGSHSLDAYQNAKVKDFSSLSDDIKPYVIITKEREELIQIIFEPTNKMLEVMKNKSPRKIMEF